jgi:hypothetical protein
MAVAAAAARTDEQMLLPTTTAVEAAEARADEQSLLPTTTAMAAAAARTDEQIIFSQPRHIVPALCQQHSAHVVVVVTHHGEKTEVLTDASCVAEPKEEQAFLW